jgi:hypothetical protein
MSIPTESSFSSSAKCSSCFKLQLYSNLYFCFRCVSLRCSDAKCTTSSVEVVACPRCLRTSTPIEASQRLQGRCDSGISCLDCPKCGAALLGLDKKSPDATDGATHKCKECLLRARFITAQDSSIDEDSVTASTLVQCIKLSTIVTNSLCSPDPIRMSSFEASQRLHRIELRKQRNQSLKGVDSKNSIATTGTHILKPVMATQTQNLFHEERTSTMVPWLGCGNDTRLDVSTKSATHISLEREQLQSISTLENRSKNNLQTLFGFKQQSKDNNVINVNTKSNGTRLASFRQVRCSTCVSIGNPGVLVSVSTDPFKALLAEASERVLNVSKSVKATISWSPAYIYRKQSPAAALLPLLSLIPVDDIPINTTSISMTRDVSTIKAKLHIKNPTIYPMFLSFWGNSHTLQGSSNSSSSTVLSIDESRLQLLDAKSGDTILLVRTLSQSGDINTSASLKEGLESIYIRISPNDPLHLHDDEGNDSHDIAVVNSAANNISKRVVAAEGVGSITLNCNISLKKEREREMILIQVPFLYHISQKLLEGEVGDDVKKQSFKSLAVTTVLKIK